MGGVAFFVPKSISSFESSELIPDEAGESRSNQSVSQGTLCQPSDVQVYVIHISVQVAEFLDQLQKMKQRTINSKFIVQNASQSTPLNQSKTHDP